MGCAGHCLRCGGHRGWCSDHTACHVCQCAPMGWQCPTCGSGLAPTTTRCPCVELPSTGPKQFPWWPAGTTITIIPTQITPVGEIVGPIYVGDPPGSVGGAGGSGQVSSSYAVN